MSNLAIPEAHKKKRNDFGGLEIFRGLLAGGSAIILTVLVTLYRAQLSQYQEYGYPGILVACFIANSTVFLPAPSSAIVMNFGAVYDPFWVAAAGGIGAAMGDCIGYFAGQAGKPFASRSSKFISMRRWLNASGWLTIFVFAFLPLPLFDFLGFLAGASGMRWYRFMPPLFFGKLAKMMMYAYVGAGLLPMLEPYIQKVIN